MIFRCAPGDAFAWTAVVEASVPYVGADTLRGSIGRSPNWAISNSDESPMFLSESQRKVGSG